MVRCLLVFALFSTTAFANDYLGRAPYALQNSHYDCDALVAAIKDVKDFRYAWVYNTFDNVANGGNVSCVQKLNALPQTTVMEVHLINETCQRNNDCGQYEFLYGSTVAEYREGLKNRHPALMKKLDAYLALSAQRILPTLKDRVKCLVSPGLESNLHQAAALVVIEETKKYFGQRCEIVWNPVNNNSFSDAIPGTVHEFHGPSMPLNAPCMTNLDGVDINLPDRPSFMKSFTISSKDVPAYVQKYGQCYAALLWIAEDNCFQAGQFVDPRARTNCTPLHLQTEVASLVGGAGVSTGKKTKK